MLIVGCAGLAARRATLAAVTGLAVVEPGQELALGRIALGRPLRA